MIVLWDYGSLLADLGDPTRITISNNHWTSILAKCKNVASALGIHAEFEEHCPSKRNWYKYNETNQAPTSGTVTGQLSAEAKENDSTVENTFKHTVFYVILD